MSQLQKLKSLLGNPSDDDVVLQFCLDRASDIICDMRNSNAVETKYLNTQLSMAIELFNKRGVEGQTGHDEHGIARTYERSDISKSLLSTIIPVVKTPYSTVRDVL